jgi:hypothetical protein
MLALSPPVQYGRYCAVENAVEERARSVRCRLLEEARMAAMKPRTGDGPLEVTKEGRGIVMRVPLEGGGRLVVEMSAEEAAALSEALKTAVD